MSQRQSHGELLSIASKIFKYFLLFSAGCTFMYIVSRILRLRGLAKLMVSVLEHGLSRAFVLVLCGVLIAVIIESLKH